MGSFKYSLKLGRRSAINTWLDAFLTYISIYISAHPESTQGLLTYMYTVKLGASRSTGLGWREYDQQFRLKKSNAQLYHGVL